MSRVDAPPVVSEDVEHAEDEDKECSRPLGLEANGDHNTSPETNNRDDDAGNSPLALEDEANEQEDQENTSSQEETVIWISFGR